MVVVHQCKALTVIRKSIWVETPYYVTTTRTEWGNPLATTDFYSILMDFHQLAHTSCFFVFVRKYSSSCVLATNSSMRCSTWCISRAALSVCTALLIFSCILFIYFTSHVVLSFSSCSWRGFVDSRLRLVRTCRSCQKWHQSRSFVCRLAKSRRTWSAVLFRKYKINIKLF